MDSRKPYCILPWFHVTSHTDGGSTPCCTWKGWISPDRAMDFFNGPQLADLRRRMLAHDPPQECADCLRHERLGTFSPRDDGWSIYKTILGHGDEISDPSLEFIELNFSNICNLKCRMCANDRSSKWASDAEAMGFHVYGKVVNDVQITDEMVSTLRFIRILGGEPLLHADQITDILSRFRTAGRLGELCIGITTNGMVMPSDDLLDLLSGCRNVWWTVSIDAYGALNDYIRTGSAWDTIVSHLDHMTSMSGIRSGGWGVNIGTVCMQLNVNKMRELADFVDDRYPMIGDRHYWYPLSFPEYLSVDRLPEGYLRWLADEYDAMPGIHPTRAERWWKPLAAHLRQAASVRQHHGRMGEYAVYSGPSLEMNDKLDGLRGESLAAVNPEIRHQLEVARNMGTVNVVHRPHAKPVGK
jgi:hypothetical protein